MGNEQAKLPFGSAQGTVCSADAVRLAELMEEKHRLLERWNTRFNRRTPQVDDAQPGNDCQVHVHPQRSSDTHLPTGASALIATTSGGDPVTAANDIYTLKRTLLERIERKRALLGRL